MANEKVSMIVGLGNPGPEYHRTRHNAGFDYVDELAKRQGLSLSLDKKYFGEVGSVFINTHKVWLLKPMTFMNRSGQSVAALANFYKIPVEEILVVHDELDLPPGVAKFKKGGGHGGHNGLKDIISKMANSREFKRLRIGIGHPGSAPQVVNYVLKKAPANELDLTDQAIDEAIVQIDKVVIGDWTKAMTEMNGFKAG